MRTSITCTLLQGMYMKYWWDSQKEKDDKEDTDIDGWIILDGC
jgi:hypothetical protein